MQYLYSAMKSEDTEALEDTEAHVPRQPLEPY